MRVKPDYFNSKTKRSVRFLFVQTPFEPVCPFQFEGKMAHFPSGEIEGLE